MKLIAFLAALLIFTSGTRAQVQATDFINVKKKNGRNIKTYFPGLRIVFETRDHRGVDGEITAIRHDSIFVKEYDIRLMPTTLGINLPDTVGVYVNGFHYSEIYKFSLDNKFRFTQVTLPHILIIGGVGYAILNIFNGRYFNQSITDASNLRHLGIAAAAAGTGVLIQYLQRHGDHNGGRYRIEYVHMNEPGKVTR